MRYIVLTGFLCAALTCSAYAQGMDMLPNDNRIRVLRYSPDDIYVIHMLYGYQTHIEFAPHEDIQTISVGDRSLWQIIPAGSRLFIRPMADDVSTNMTVITNKRSYQFDIKSGHGTPEKNPQMVYVARFSYPDERPPVAVMAAPVMPVAPVAVQPAPTIEPSPPVSTAAVKTAPAMSVSLPPASSKQNYLYTYSGPDADAPEEVYDDGHSTFVRFADMTRPLPKVFLSGPNGQETQVAVSVHNGYMVIAAVADRLALMRDGSTVYLYNETLAGSAL